MYHVPVIDKNQKWRCKSTLQLGDGSIIAEKTGITTVFNFRIRDIVVGGAFT